mgnify:CR=1 FL=1
MKKYKIYFAGSIRGGREDVDLYLQMIEHLKKYGEVFTEHVGDRNLALLGEDNIDNTYICERDLTWIAQSDVFIAEITTASYGVGFETREAVDLKKQILLLYRQQEGKIFSAIGAGYPTWKGITDWYKLRYYNTIDEAKLHIDQFFSELTTRNNTQ